MRRAPSRVLPRGRRASSSWLTVGTVFLDEIGDMSLETQAKLLRCIAGEEIRAPRGQSIHTGGCSLYRCYQQDLLKMVREGSFREDLYYRLNVFPIVLPPLREREDISALTDYFLKGASKPVKIAPEAMERLKEYSWPGNVRELQGAIERAALIAESGVIETAHLPANILDSGDMRPSAELTTEGVSIDDQLEAV